MLTEPVLQLGVNHNMIQGKIETFCTAAGGKLYRGWCVVRDESVTAGDVMSHQIPDGPQPGFERLTRYWRNTQGAHGSRCEFEIEDRRPGAVEDVARVGAVS